MRLKYSVALPIIFLSVFCIAQSTSDFAVQLSAEVQSDPPLITLSWPESPATTYFVHRKLKSATDWGSTYATLPADATAFTDTLVSKGISYEYRILRSASTHTGFGYINSGIEVPETDQRGGLLLLVDSTLAMTLDMEIERLRHDLEMDGWVVWRFDISEHVSVDSVKALIRQQYVATPGFIKSVFLLGHIAVPYSGNISPDGHPDHNGAWPADVFYGDMNGVWPDVAINNDGASDPRNDNIPGDGKFDPSLLPSDVELQVGRVDFTNLPVFNSDAVTLTRNYLDRNHAFRMREVVPVERAVVDDNFGAFGGEAFAASAYRNFASMVSPANISEGDYRTELASGSHLLSYGCGGGSYTSCSGVGTSNDFAGDSLLGAFTMLFGSYFGDWDRQNNLMRVVLAQGTMLAISWAGRPHWMYHHMGLGESIGYSARLTQNNSSLYAGNYGMRFIHVALLGDPSLRLRYTAPVSGLTASVSDETHVLLDWKSADPPALGYKVYRRTSPTEMFTAVSSDIIMDTQYIDSCMVDPGIYEYMVRSINLLVTPSGSYYDLGTGVSDTVLLKSSHAVEAAFEYTLTDDTLRITANTSLNATSYLWDFGDGNFSSEDLPEHVYVIPGQYVVTLFATSECDESMTSQELDILSSLELLGEGQNFTVYPSPAHDELVVFLGDSRKSYNVVLSRIDGTVVWSRRDASGGRLQVDVQVLPRGAYLVQVIDHKGFSSIRKVLLQ